jgi:hypothetical protein
LAGIGPAFRPGRGFRSQGRVLISGRWRLAEGQRRLSWVTMAESENSSCIPISVCYSRSHLNRSRIGAEDGRCLLELERTKPSSSGFPGVRRPVKPGSPAKRFFLPCSTSVFLTYLLHFLGHGQGIEAYAPGICPPPSGEGPRNLPGPPRNACVVEGDTGTASGAKMAEGQC